jgi:hypothetical protein
VTCAEWTGSRAWRKFFNFNILTDAFCHFLIIYRKNCLPCRKEIYRVINCLKYPQLIPPYLPNSTHSPAWGFSKLSLWKNFDILAHQQEYRNLIKPIIKILCKQCRASQDLFTIASRAKIERMRARHKSRENVNCVLNKKKERKMLSSQSRSNE